MPQKEEAHTHTFVNRMVQTHTHHTRVKPFLLWEDNSLTSTHSHIYMLFQPYATLFLSSNIHSWSH